MVRGTFKEPENHEHLENLIQPVRGASGKSIAPLGRAEGQGSLDNGWQRFYIADGEPENPEHPENLVNPVNGASGKGVARNPKPQTLNLNSICFFLTIVLQYLYIQ